jgi:hypothetical protein
MRRLVSDELVVLARDFQCRGFPTISLYLKIRQEVLTVDEPEMRINHQCVILPAAGLVLLFAPSKE